MESLDDLSCPVCLEISRDAVESDCCGHAFCNDCAELVKGKQNECPYCKQSPFLFREGKLIRRMISGIKVSCPNQKCQTKVSNADLPNHLEYCLLSFVACRVCNQNFLRGDLVKHTMGKHEDEATKAIIDFQNASYVKSKISSISTNSSKVGSSISNVTGSTVIDPANQIKNKTGRKAIIGTSGKYYCGGPLLLKCTCCDGNCGPTNGENCLACMELDVKMRSLPRGYLVNSVGMITKADIKAGTAYCGAPSSSFSNQKCRLGNPCRLCGNLMKTLKRYQTLI